MTLLVRKSATVLLFWAVAQGGSALRLREPRLKQAGELPVDATDAITKIQDEPAAPAVEDDGDVSDKFDKSWFGRQAGAVESVAEAVSEKGKVLTEKGQRFIEEGQKLLEHAREMTAKARQLPTMRLRPKGNKPPAEVPSAIPIVETEEPQKSTAVVPEIVGVDSSRGPSLVSSEEIVNKLVPEENPALGEEEIPPEENQQAKPETPEKKPIEDENKPEGTA